MLVQRVTTYSKFMFVNTMKLKDLHTNLHIKSCYKSNEYKLSQKREPSTKRACPEE